MRAEQRVGAAIRRARIEAGLSQQALGDLLHPVMHQTTVAKLEAAARPIRVDEVDDIADVLGVPALALLDVEQVRA